MSFRDGNNFSGRVETKAGNTILENESYNRVFKFEKKKKKFLIIVELKVEDFFPLAKAYME